MKIAVLSGKGGTGKTFVSIGLTAAAKGPAVYVDCDAEEPNGYLFLKPKQVNTSVLNVTIPSFDNNLCIGCRKCADFCHFNAIAMINDKPRLFSEVCHPCGGCSLVCPTGAITETKRPVGMLKIGKYNQKTVITGILNPGEASSVPVISSALDAVPENSPLVIIDCPPGSSCSVTESIKKADYCIIVAEPTAFGLHNLKMVFELTQILGKPTGVVINKYEHPYKDLDDFFAKNNISVLAQIPFNREIGLANSRGVLITDTNQKLADLFYSILLQIGGECL